MHIPSRAYIHRTLFPNPSPYSPCLPKCHSEERSDEESRAHKGVGVSEILRFIALRSE